MHDPTADAYSDACLYGGGGVLHGFCVLVVSQVGTSNICLHKNIVNKAKDLIDINILEFMAITVILNYAVVPMVIQWNGLHSVPHPVLLAWTENFSAVQWMTKVCMTLLVNHVLGHLCCGLVIDFVFSINTQ